VSSNGIIQAFRAQTLLGADAEIFQRIELLRKRLHYSTDGEVRSFDDYFTILREAVDAIPKLELQTDVVPGGENQYGLEMAQTMERIVDDCDRIMRKLAHFQGKLRDAERQVSNLKAEFVAWYILAASPILAELDGVKLAARELRALAEAEFSSLITSADISVSSMLEDIKIEFSRVASHKSAQREKHDLGKDQINASWTSVLPAYGGAIPPDLSELGKPQEEDDEDGMPEFVSRKNSAFPTQQELDKAKPGDTVVIRFTENASQIAAGVGDSGIRGTFKKTGDPQPVVAVKTDEFVPPRRKLIFDDEGDEI
jgi:hypothetical protein